MTKTKLGILLALVLLLSACATSHGVKTPTATVPPSNLMTFVVGSTDDGMQKDVEVLLVENASSLIPLGTTDEFGRFSVPKDTLRRGKVVLFCRSQWYFCGAFRIDDPALKHPDFLDYSEHFIQLAPLALR
jgi:hypothetical protein